ncbi:MAG: hypothetical protein IKC38_05980 [Clostridia bacterium]|nr:hypothetical protein [Clostridia bacterium]
MSYNLDEFSIKKADTDSSAGISLVDIFKVLKQKVIWIALVTLIATIGSFLITKFFVTPKYTSSVMVYVYNEKEGGYTSSDLSLSKSLVNTYVVMIESDTLLTQVINSLDLDMSCNQLRKMISASAVNNTEVFKINVEHADPGLAKDIAGSISQLAPSFLEEKAHAGSVEIIDYAQIPTQPTSPSLARNMIIGFILGLIVSVAIIVGSAIFDTKIYDENDLISKFEVPVLGSVPNIVVEVKKEV